MRSLLTYCGRWSHWSETEEITANPFYELKAHLPRVSLLVEGLPGTVSNGVSFEFSPPFVSFIMQNGGSRWFHC